MKRPLHAWVVFSCCALVVVAALGWITREALRQEKMRQQGEAYAEQQELIRLALWRMESQLSALVVQENARPPEQFRAFVRQDTALSRDLRAWQGPPLLVPSPLIRGPDASVLLHFEWREDGKVESPQAPEGAVRQAALSNGMPADVLGTCSSLLGQLQATLGGKAVASTMSRAKASEAETRDLSETLRAESAMAGQPPPAPAAKLAEAPQAPQISKQMQYNEKEQVARNTFLTQTVTAGNLQSKNLAAGESLAYADEPRKRQAGAAAADKTKVTAAGRTRAVLPKLESAAPAPAAPSSLAAAPLATAAAAPAPAPPAAPVPMTVQVDAFAADDLAKKNLPAMSAYTVDAVIADGKVALGLPSEADGRSVIEDAKPFRPLWHDGRLLLIRTVTGGAKPLLQGVWLNWEHLRQSLLKSIGDLLPAAKLDAVAAALPDGKSVFERLAKYAGSSEAATVSDPLQLVSIPVRLDPGPVIAAAGGPLWTPLCTTLAIAWLGAMLAAGAVALLLRGTLVLSERRADFVSAVTHELRTPLTTFRMYSEMLASGMVKDEAKSKSYLDTLQSESGRLAHLVENVLRYSRLERGSAKAVVEDVAAGDLLERIWPHLEERAARSGMTVERSLPDEAAQARLRIDAGVAEQIFLNLVDNACKYAAPHTEHQVIRIEARAGGRAVEFAVRDYGRGFSPAELKRLFKPFRKSAEKAAHTAEGVGLGLALSRRLARALGGDLSLDRSVSPGACFTVRLPRAPK